MLQTILNARYQIIKKLGQGGFGTTYLVEDIQASRTLYAIKQLNPDHADIETAKKLFQREADILLRLGELPGVPKFIDYFEENERHYIVEEYIKGTSLDELLEQEWNCQQIVIFLWDTLSILQKLHQQNIIHRDIKPSNLIKRERDCKYTIIDFGAVKELKQSQLGIHGTSIATFGYTPLEQQIGLPQLNSDIYALGMTAIQLLTKTHPKNVVKDENDNIVWTQNAICTAGAYAIAPEFLTDILNKMVKNKFQERYQSVEEIFKAIEQGKVIKTSTSSGTEEPTLINHRIPWYIPLILVTILLIGSEIISPWIRPRYYLHQGNSLLDKNQAEKSLTKFQQAIDLQRNFASAWKSRGDALFILRRYPGALEAYQQAIDVQPNNLKALNNQGKILYQLGQFQQAIEAHQQAIQIDANNAEAWSSKGIAHMGLQQHEQALLSFDKAREIKPDEPSIWLQKGIVLKVLQRPNEAEQFYQEALGVYNEKVTTNDRDPLLWTDRGTVLLQLNRPQEALDSYNKALSLDRNFYEALLGKANALSLLQKYELALEILNKATEIRPQDYQVWYNQGNILAQALQKPKEAFTSFEKATQIKPDFYPAWLGKGLTLISLKRYQEAIQTLNTAKDLNPQDPFVWIDLGIAFEKTGQFQAALKSYQKAAIDLNYEPANEYIDKLQQIQRN
jgi:tetratricopeptide (TPR) repeat protein